MSLDDIWSEPLVDPVISIPEQEVADKARPKRASLFLSDSEDEDTGNGRRASPSTSPSNGNNVPSNPEAAKLDEMFAGLDDDDDDPFAAAPALDVEKMKRQAAARLAATAPKTNAPSATTQPYAVGDTSSPAQDKGKEEKGKKTKRVMPKLDEERLLGHDGFPRLIKEYKNFKITGKGHEATDLERLFRIYHAWTHKMYPKFQFKDTVDRVERLCRSRRMTVNLRAWRDEAHGINTDVRHEVDLGDEERADEEREDDGDADVGSGAVHDQPRASSPSSSRPSTPITRPSSVASTAPSVPSSATDVNDDDMDIDALLREEEELSRQLNEPGNTSLSYKPSNADDEDDAMWAAAGGIIDDIPKIDVQEKPAAPVPSVHGEADDEDMWNMVDEMDTQPSMDVEQNRTNVESSTLVSATGGLTNPPAVPSEQSSIGAEWDDMYA